MRLALREGPMEALLEWLDQDVIDIAIGRMASGFGSDLYKLDLLRHDMPLFVARQGHPATLTPMSLQDLVAFPWVLPPQPNIVRQQLEFAARDMGLRLPSEVLSSQVSPLVFHVASRSDTLVLSSQCIVDELRERYRLEPVQCDLPLHIGPLVAITRNDKPLSRASSMFLDELRQLLDHGPRTT